MRFPIVEEMAKTIAKKALDEYEYEGKTIRQWVEVLKDYDDKKSTMERIVERLEGKRKDVCGTYNSQTPTLERTSCKVAFNNGICEAITVVKEEGGIE